MIIQTIYVDVEAQEPTVSTVIKRNYAITLTFFKDSKYIDGEEYITSVDTEQKFNEGLTTGSDEVATFIDVTNVDDVNLDNAIVEIEQWCESKNIIVNHNTEVER